ncbi:MAG: tRNA preQ1(34) S-adenosylmethionine ribosyltransferase-isomerase QueA [Candidatus Magasanikbacteria bacterium]|jgi:S-adenosylmethionine:tRNA ribosyltransferase-isomerase|nr:tRNA preQ1(34) S-adenosylmethionine ribosyltransferase-isomerase QueA [Candidatus Magasanikbacteria bacterium]
MKTSEFDFDLPQDQIAQHSVEPRDQSKLMVVDTGKKTTEHKQFFNVVDYFRKGDVLVWNNSKVFKARLAVKLLSKNDEELWEHKRDIEIFLVRPKENAGVWQVLAKPGKHVKNGMRVHITDHFFADVMVKEADGTVLVQWFKAEGEIMTDEEVRAAANMHGSIPIPPYVKDEPHQFESYQTVYAKEEGSVAAPTAGFHFTDEIIAKLKEKGVQFAEVTLHVGLGTFLPVKSERIEDHTMHAEWVELSKDHADMINAAKKEGRRIVAVGTTSTRTLEGIASLPLYKNSGNKLPAFSGDINIFIMPGFKFQIVDALITNFHLPKSTLLMLVSAFAGDREFMLQCYKEAVHDSYRFFSFGDAMFIS